MDGTKRRGVGLYGGLNPADLPRYTRKDAERATGVPASTVGVWVRGMPYTSKKGTRGRYDSIITLPDQNDPRLSFNNLLEVNVLRALRAVHEVKLQSVRHAMESAKKEHGIDRLLTHPNLRSSGGTLFLDYYFNLVDLSNSEQLAMRSILAHSLRRVDVDEEDRYVFFPAPRLMPQDTRPILVSPYVSFGSAVLERRGVSTYAIRSRIDAGEEKAAVMDDYDLKDDEFEEAIRYELAA